MRPRHFPLRAAAPFIVMGLVAAVCVPVAPAQSLGDIARAEEERRKAITAPGKLYTNESLRPDPTGPRPGGAPATGSPGGAAGTPAAPPSPSGGQQSPPAAADPAAPASPEVKKDEAYWRQRMQTARDSLQRAEIFADALQSRINALSADFTARDDPAQRDVIGRDRQAALAELERVRQEIDQHTKSIAAVQDEARRAGVPPGWLR